MASTPPFGILRESPSDLSVRSGSDQEDVLRMRLTFGGIWERQADNFQYIGGETYMEKLPYSIRYADLMHLVNEKTNGATIFKYTPPGEKPGPNNLVTVLDDDHLQEMIEDYQMIASSSESPKGRRFRLLVWLSKAEEDVVTLEDIEMTRKIDWSSETEPSERSDGTHSPMMKSSGWAPGMACNGSNDVDVQMMVAQETCLYMNNIEEAEGVEHYTVSSPWDSQPNDKIGHYAQAQYHPDSPKDLQGMHHLDFPTEAENRWLRKSESFDMLTSKMSKFRGLSPLSQMFSPPAEIPAHDAGQQQDSVSSPTKYDSPAPQTPVHPDEKSLKLPPNLGSSLGNTQTSSLQRSTHFRLPSKLGSSLGNTRCGTLRSLSMKPDQVSPVDSVAYKMDILSNASTPPQDSAQKPESGRSTPNGSHGGSMDNFHIVPLSEITPIAKLGEGTFGEVLQCSNKLFGQIAVKCAKTEGDKHLFSQEVRMLSSLNHPNVLRFFGVVTKDSQGSEIIGVMTEFMQGRSLSHYLGPGSQRLSLLERSKLARGAVNGLMYLHKHNLIHFDLKPENLLLDYPLGHGRHSITPGIKVADFGLSKYKVDDYASAETGLRGTVPYMAPEIVVDREHVTEKADIWSLGMVLWEMFTHRVPFGNMPGAEIVARLRLGNAYPHIPPDMEQEWAELIDACCRPFPNDRFSLENIAAMLDQIIQQESAHSPQANLY